MEGACFRGECPQVILPKRAAPPASPHGVASEAPHGVASGSPNGLCRHASGCLKPEFSPAWHTILPVAAWSAIGVPLLHCPEVAQCALWGAGRVWGRLGLRGCGQPCSEEARRPAVLCPAALGADALEVPVCDKDNGKEADLQGRNSVHHRYSSRDTAHQAASSIPSSTCRQPAPPVCTPTRALRAQQHAHPHPRSATPRTHTPAHGPTHMLKSTCTNMREGPSTAAREAARQDTARPGRPHAGGHRAQTPAPASQTQLPRSRLTSDSCGCARVSSRECGWVCVLKG